MYVACIVLVVSYLHKAEVEERVCVYFSFVWFVYVAMCFPPALHDIYFIRLWHDITGCAVAQHCYNGDVSFLWENRNFDPL